MKSEPTRYEALCTAVTRCSTQETFAEVVGVSQPTVSRWLNVTRQLPAEYVLRVEAATGVSRHHLRPDIYPREEMIDRLTPDRLVGIDRQIAARQDLQRTASRSVEMRKAG